MKTIPIFFDLNVSVRQLNQPMERDKFCQDSTNNNEDIRT